SVQAGLDPAVMSVASAVSLLLGFLLVVETMPNVVAHSTGRVTQKDFLWPGIWATLASIAIMTLVAYTYWRWIGFCPYIICKFCMMHNKNIKLAVISVDVIGMEVVPASLRVLNTIADIHGGLKFEYEQFDYGCDYYLKHGSMMAPDGMERLGQS